MFEEALEGILQEEKVERWKEKRSGFITASPLKFLTPPDRGNSMFRATVGPYLYGIKYEIRTGIKLRHVDARQFKWGHENEPRANQWLRDNVTGMYPLKSCSDDFDDIIIVSNPLVPNFKDSPDTYLYDLSGKLKAVIEIKCPVDQAKIEAQFEVKSIDSKHEDYPQLMGHFIGHPDIDEVWLVKYDAYVDDARYWKLFRKDHLAGIQEMTMQILVAGSFIQKLKEGKDVCIADILKLKK